MSDRWIGIRDPREGEWPEDGDWCHEHGQRKESCGPCWDADRDLQVTVEDVLGRALVEMLDRVQMTDDEAMGAHFAARFDKGE